MNMPITSWIRTHSGWKIIYYWSGSQVQQQFFLMVTFIMFWSNTFISYNFLKNPLHFHCKTLTLLKLNSLSMLSSSTNKHRTLWVKHITLTGCTVFIYLFIFIFYFIFKLYIIVLVFPNIQMNPPQVYTCKFIRIRACLVEHGKTVFRVLWEEVNICDTFREWKENVVQLLSHVWLFATPWTEENRAKMYVRVAMLYTSSKF